MSQAQDPERLLADALRAQARGAPPAGLAPETPPLEYGLLSGADARTLERERDAIDGPVTAPSKPATGSLPAYWILGLAVLLGLATGVVIGLISLT